MSYSYEQNSVKERIRDATDIVELVGQYIPLKRSGGNYVGKCPWHDDTRPSLQINPERQTFKCWVCDIGGDVFAFVMKIENVDFREALEILADRAGLALPRFSKTPGINQAGMESGQADGMEITRKQLFQTAEWVARSYHEELLHSAEAAVVRDYLSRRAMSAEAIDKFQIGYAPMDKNWLIAKAGHQIERIKMLEIIGNFRPPKTDSDGLITKSTVSRSDFFRGRLIFPIRDEQGRTVAFGGRLVPDSPLSHDPWHKDRKYLNSPESQLFSKHKVLYGLDTAKHRIKTVRRALIVEGYTDCIVAHQFGFGEAVAVLGTALGPDHIKLLTRMGAEKIILMLDGDKAGQAKAESDKVLRDFISQGADMAVLTLPDGLDPCDFLEHHGAEALDMLLQTETVDALEHVFRAKTRGIDLRHDIIGSSNALNTILEIIGHAPMKGTSPHDPIRLRIEKAVQNLSVRFTMPEDVVRHRLKLLSTPSATSSMQVANDVSVNESQNADCWSKDQLPDLLEREMLELWLIDPTAIYAFWEHVLPEHLRSPVTLLIYKQCVDLIEHQEKPATFNNLMTSFDDPWMKKYLIELEMSGREKFCGNEPDSKEIGREHWNQSTFRELKERSISEILAAFNKQEQDRQRRAELNRLRSPDLSDAEKTEQLLELQRKLRGNTARD